MFIEPTITWVPPDFSGYIILWLDTKIVLKKLDDPLIKSSLQYLLTDAETMYGSSIFPFDIYGTGPSRAIETGTFTGPFEDVSFPQYYLYDRGNGQFVYQRAITRGGSIIPSKGLHLD